MSWDDITGVTVGRLKPIPEVDYILYNPPATVVFWKDGTKTVSKVGKMDNFEEDFGFLACLAKKVYGHRSSYMSHVERGIKTVDGLYNLRELIYEALASSPRLKSNYSGKGFLARILSVRVPNKSVLKEVKEHFSNQGFLVEYKNSEDNLWDITIKHKPIPDENL